MKAVIVVNGKQYLVAKGDKVTVDHLADQAKTLAFEPLLTFDGKDVKVGTPTVKGGKVTANVAEAEVKGEKVRAIRFKAKKRVHKVRGQRPLHSVIEITAVA